MAIAHLRREVQLREFTAATVVSRTDEPDKRPIKASARSTDWCRGLLNSFWPSRYEEFLEENPLPVLGGVSDAERCALRTLLRTLHTLRTLRTLRTLAPPLSRRRVLETLNSEERVHSEMAQPSQPSPLTLWP